MKPMIKLLEAERDHAKIAAQHNKDGWDKASRTAAEAVAERDNLRRQIADLKERLTNAETENQRMRGYIQRVQEDDVVREELITTGDPQGEQVMIPKRRPTTFNEPHPMSGMGAIDDRFHNGYRDEPRRKPLHWIRYG